MTRDEARALMDKPVTPKDLECWGASALSASDPDNDFPAKVSPWARIVYRLIRELRKQNAISQQTSTTETASGTGS